MKKLFLVSIIAMVILTGCGREEVSEPTLSSEGVEEILVEEILVEEILVEEILIEEIMTP